MPIPDAFIRVVATDLIKGDLIIHFSDGISVLYRALFLYEVRSDDGNVTLPDTPDLDDTLDD